MHKLKKKGEGADLKFSLDSVELELTVAVTKSEGVEGGIKFWVIEAGGEHKQEHLMTHNFKLVLKPTSPGAIVVSNKTDKKTSGR